MTVCKMVRDIHLFYTRSSVCALTYINAVSDAVPMQLKLGNVSPHLSPFGKTRRSRTVNARPSRGSGAREPVLPSLSRILDHRP